MGGDRAHFGSGSEFEALVGYSRAVRIGDQVLVAGTTGAGDDIVTQTRDALTRIESALTQAGASLSDVVRTRMFVTDISRWRDVGAVHAEVFGAVRPVSTMVEVAALISPGLYVEIEVDAHIVNGANVPSGPGR
ncbi:RidA family protein [Mycolicibacterium baixiangningiae]|uniref:RidA family protein n=1 Tax=Mycolicibacterium baixiangningiae TaxID=2761578 RepID=UPI0018665A1F|nr:RidA family protein [Mycolicibacterium baixiangningiae]